MAWQLYHHRSDTRAEEAWHVRHRILHDSAAEQSPKDWLQPIMPMRIGQEIQTVSRTGPLNQGMRLNHLAMINPRGARADEVTDRHREDGAGE
jgi:hypothetical protein